MPECTFENYDACVLISKQFVKNDSVVCIQVPNFVDIKKIIYEYVDSRKFEKATLWPNIDLLTLSQTYFVGICMPSRLDHFKAQCDHAKIVPHIINVTGAKTTLNCSKSHENALINFLKTDKQICVVFEDDVALCKDFREKLEKVHFL